jgi:hypothetical protein
MPPPSEISGFDPRFFRPCIFPVLRRLGYGVRPTINNGLSAGHPNATPLEVSLSMFDEAGGHLGTSAKLAELAPGEIVKFDLEEVLARPDVRERIEESDGDQLGVFHLVPTALSGQDAVTAKPGELMAHMLASDDFIEYHQHRGPVITGVAYQTGPKNDPRFGSTQTTVVQAPKVIVSEPVDTLFALMNVSTHFDYDRPVELDFWILRPDGTRVTRSQISVPAWTYRLVSATEVLERAGALEEFRAHGGMGMLLGYAKEGTVIPLSLTRNKQSGAIACDHTLPPVFYVTTWGGKARLDANARLEQEFFSEPKTAPQESLVR